MNSKCTIQNDYNTDKKQETVPVWKLKETTLYEIVASATVSGRVLINKKTTDLSKIRSNSKRTINQLNADTTMNLQNSKVEETTLYEIVASATVSGRVLINKL